MPKRTQRVDLIEQLQTAIRSCGVSLNELARQAGVNHGQLSRFVRGERTLTLPAASRVCQVLGLRLAKDIRAP